MAEVSDFRKMKFIELCASGVAPYRAAIDAGYSEKYAKNYASTMLEKYGNEIDKYKARVQAKLQAKIEYSTQDSINTFRKIQELAMGENNNLQAAIKCEENIAKLLGLYEVDNSQKNGINNIIINREIVDGNTNI